MVLPLLFLIAQLAEFPQEFRERPSWPENKLPLDSLERTVDPAGKIQCPKVELVHYPGDVVHYASPLRVNPDFRARLRLFEQVVRETATEIYGRPPRQITHLGSFNCRRIRKWPEYLSEHGLGNAIDISGFDFPPLPRKAKIPPDLPRI